MLKFNRWALELITILGASLTITWDNPLWEEYLQKLPEATTNHVSQQTHLMNVLMNKQLTLLGMMDIVAERAMPLLTHVPSMAGIPMARTTFSITSEM